MDDIEIEEDAMMEALLESGIDLDEIEVVDLTETTDEDTNPVTVEPASVPEINSIQNCASERPVLLNICGDLVRPLSSIEQIVASIIEEGFECQAIERALRASFNDRKLARKYLVTSIPPYLAWTSSTSTSDSSMQSARVLSDVGGPSTRTRAKSGAKSNVPKGGKSCEEKIYVPNAFAKLITEKKTKIGNDSNCAVTVQLFNKTKEATPCTLRGSNNSIQRARECIWEIIRTRSCANQRPDLQSHSDVSAPSSSSLKSFTQPMDRLNGRKKSNSFTSVPTLSLYSSDPSSRTAEEPVLNVLAVNLEGYKEDMHIPQLRDIQHQTGFNVLVICEAHFAKVRRRGVASIAEVKILFSDWFYYPVPCYCKYRNRFAGYHGMAIFSRFESDPDPKPIILVPSGKIDHRQIGITFKTYTGERVNLLGVHYRCGDNNDPDKRIQVFTSKEWFLNRKGKDIDICIGDMNCHPKWKIRGEFEHRFKECGMVMESKIQIWDENGGIDCWTHIKGNMLDQAFVRTGEGLRTEVKLHRERACWIESDHPRYLQVLIYRDNTAVPVARNNLDEVCVFCKKCGRPYKNRVDQRHSECPFKSIFALLTSSKMCKEKAKKRKLSIKTRERKYICGICGKTFTFFSYLNRHKRIHAGDKPHVCDVCQKGFAQLSSLVEHKRGHTGDKPYVCDVCEKGFPRLSSLTVHKRIHIGDKPYVCDVCGKGFVNKGNSIVHQNSHATYKQYLCDLCGKGFAHSRNLKLHKRIHTGDKPHVCDVCENGFVTSSRLKVHKRIHTGDKPHVCDICEKGFARSSSLIVHKRIHTGDKPHVCEVCKKGFINKDNLKVHKRIHTGDKPHKCDVCEKGFAQLSTLVAHKRIHTRDKPHVCDVCKKAFTQLSSLVEHKRVHTGDKPYVCDVCEKGFARSSSLVVHKRIHTGDKPYVCDVCEKSFVSSSKLTVHKRVHTGDKPYVCDVCEKGFSRSSILIVHKRIHAGDKPHVCEVCKKGFVSKYNLKVHERIHAVDKPHVCHICSKTFATWCQLSRHKKSKNCKQF